MKKSLLVILLFVLTLSLVSGKDYKVTSPDGKISVTVNVGAEIKWSATFDGKEKLLIPQKIAMVLDNGKIFGENEKVKSAKLTVE